jgi:hypothetical protein
MATAAKFVPPILIFWAYLIPLDVDGFSSGKFFLSDCNETS